MACIPFQAERVRVRLFLFVAWVSLARSTSLEKSRTERLKRDLAPLPLPKPLRRLVAPLWRPLRAAETEAIGLNVPFEPGFWRISWHM